MFVQTLSIIGVFLTPVFSFSQPTTKPRLDDHGFPLPHGAIAQLGDLRFAQPGEIIAMAISPDDKVIATAGHRLDIARLKKSGVPSDILTSH